MTDAQRPKKGMLKENEMTKNFTFFQQALVIDLVGIFGALYDLEFGYRNVEFLLLQLNFNIAFFSVL